MSCAHLHADARVDAHPAIHPAATTASTASAASVAWTEPPVGLAKAHAAAHAQAHATYAPRRLNRVATRTHALPLRVLALALPLVLAGCASPPPTGMARMPMTMPASWGDAGAASATSATSAAVSPNWWTAFNDPLLNTLIDEALAGNVDLARAVARIDESRAGLQLANADRYPAVYFQASAGRTRFSEVSRTPLFGTSPIGSTKTLQFNAQYELDFWGKFANASLAARAALLSTEAARDTVRLGVASQAAQGYFSLRALDASYEAVRRLVDSQRDGLKVQRARAENGALSPFDLARLEAELAANEARLPALAQQRSQAETALAVLLGRSPSAIYTPNLARAPLEALRGPAAIVMTPPGLPSELLLQRPDIRSAEQNLVAADARVSAARANYFPSITLTGYGGVSSAKLTDLFKGPASIWSFVSSLTQPIFQGGRLFAATEQAQAQQRQLEADYRAAVATAFKEVRDALNGVDNARTAYEAQGRRFEALQRARGLAEVRYKNGYASVLDVIDADRQLLESVVGQSDAERDQRNALVDLFRALGGGWSANTAAR